MTKFEAPTIEYFTVSPILIVLGVAVLGVLIEAFAPRAQSLPGPGRALADRTGAPRS